MIIIRSGRSNGGLAFRVRNDYVNCVHYIGHSNDKRCIAMKINGTDMQVIKFKVYFPCFVGSDSYEFDVKSIICFVENILLENTCENLNTYVLIDFNFYECKMKSHALLKCFNDFMQSMDLIMARNSVNYTYHCNATK